VSAKVKPINPEVAAQRAFEDYSAVLRRHARDMDRWDDDDRVAERAAAYDRFTALFGMIP
jgi:hypothetical protein